MTSDHQFAKLFGVRLLKKVEGVGVGFMKKHTKLGSWHEIGKHMLSSFKCGQGGSGLKDQKTLHASFVMALPFKDSPQTPLRWRRKNCTSKKPPFKVTPSLALCLSPQHHRILRAGGDANSAAAGSRASYVHYLLNISTLVDWQLNLIRRLSA